MILRAPGHVNEAEENCGRSFEVRSDGFLPGEQVYAAVVCGIVSAGARGVARVVVDIADPDAGTQVVLFGAQSGTVALGTAPS